MCCFIGVVWPHIGRTEINLKDLGSEVKTDLKLRYPFV